MDKVDKVDKDKVSDYSKMRLSPELLEKVGWLKIDLGKVVESTKPVYKCQEKINIWKLLQLWKLWDYVQWKDDDGIDYRKSYKVNGKSYIEYLLNHVSSDLKKGGEHKVPYFRNSGIGRLSTSGEHPTASTLANSVRKYIMSDYNFDLDFATCHQRIAKRIFTDLGVPCPKMDEWIEDKDKVINDSGLNKRQFKKCVNALMYGGSEKLYGKCKWLCDFAKEISLVVNVCFRINQDIYDHLKKHKLDEDKDPKPQITAYTMQHFENECLMVLKKFVEDNDYIVSSLCYDGLMVQKKKDEEKFPTNLLRLAQNEVFEKTGFEMKLVQKSLRTNIVVPKSLYKYQKKYYEEERKLCWCHASQNYLFEVDGNIDLFEESKLKKAIKKDTYIFKFHDEKPIPYKINYKIPKFTEVWLDDEERKEINNFGFVPPGLKTFRNVDLNTWCGFYFEDHIAKIKKQDCDYVFSNFVKHIAHLIGEPFEFDENDNLIWTYNLRWVISWLADIIQNPGDKKGTALIIQSIEGVGKGMLQQILTNLLMYKSQNILPVADCNVENLFGPFNSIRMNKLLMFMNELELGKSGKYDDEWKRAVADVHYTINQKQLKQFSGFSCERYIVNTNKDKPLKTEGSMRRNAYFRCKAEVRLEEMEDGKERFDFLMELRDNKEWLAQLFFCLKHWKISEKLNKPPDTDARKDQVEQAKSTIDMWLYDLCEKNVEDTFYLRSTSGALDSYKSFCGRAGYFPDAKNASALSQKLRKYKDLGFIEIDRMKDTDGKRKRCVKISLIPLFKHLEPEFDEEQELSERRNWENEMSGSG